MSGVQLSYRRFLDLHLEGGPSALYMVLDRFRPVGYMEFSHNNVGLLDLDMKVIEVYWFRDVAAIGGTPERGSGLGMMRFPDFCRMEICFRSGEVHQFDILDVCLFDRFPKVHEVIVALTRYMKGPGRAYWSDSGC